MTEMTKDAAAALRKPFDKKAIGKLPKAGMQLDYVGHAAVVDRLLAVDPQWSWEPFAVDERGLPALDSKGNLWIRMTVCGVTRIGVGDGPNAKQVVSDALRNAAMRFGVALDLWSKEELESVHSEEVFKATEPPATARKKTTAKKEPSPPPADAPLATVNEAGEPLMNADQRGKMFAQFDELGIKDRNDYRAYIENVLGIPVQSSRDLTIGQASTVIEAQIADLEAKAGVQ
jgi:hypothetical protein